MPAESERRLHFRCTRLDAPNLWQNALEVIPELLRGHMVTVGLSHGNMHDLMLMKKQPINLLMFLAHGFDALSIRALYQSICQASLKQLFEKMRGAQVRVENN